jgi:hypothetical protein
MVGAVHFFEDGGRSGRLEPYTAGGIGQVRARAGAGHAAYGGVNIVRIGHSGGEQGIGGGRAESAVRGVVVAPWWR